MLTERNPYDSNQVADYELDRMLVAACVRGGAKLSEKFENCFDCNSDEDLQRINMVGGAIRARLDRVSPPFAPGDMLAGIFKESFCGPVAHHFSTDTGTAFRIKEGESYKVENIFYEGFDSWLVSFEGIKSDHGLVVKFRTRDFVRSEAEKKVA